jgi:LPS O-antigen subunit length determinant protein (WzzB/FepE family)
MKLFMQEEEIDLKKIIKNIYSEKTTIFISTLTFVLLSILYISLKEQKYESKIFFQKPREVVNLELRDALALLGIQGYNNGYLVHLFRKNLHRTNLCKSHYKSFIKNAEDLHAHCVENLSLNTKDIKSPLLETEKEYLPFAIAVEFKLKHLQKNNLENFYNYVEKTTEKQAKEDISESIKQKISYLEIINKNELLTYKQEIEDHKLKLEEALKLAKSHENSIADNNFKNIKNPEDFELAYNSYAIIKKGGLTDSFLHLKGAEVIKSEIENIKQRDNSEPFITIYRENQKRLRYLKSIQVPNNITVADMTYSLAAKKTNTNPFLILALASLSGLMMGLMLVFFKILFREEERDNKAISTQNTAMGNA